MSRTLLLADDSVTIQRVIELTFAHEDVRVVSVGDGQRALQWMETEWPDIVLVDIEAPEVDGYAVASYVKTSPRLKHVPVLLLAGAFEPVDQERARSIGCDGVLVKPFEPEHLVSRVKELLKYSSSSSGARVDGVREVPRRAVDADATTVAAFPAAAPAPAPLRAFDIASVPSAADFRVANAGLDAAAPEPLEPPSRPVWETNPLAPQPVPVARATEAPPAAKVSLVNAFSALLAAEQSNLPPAPAAAAAPSDASVEDAVRRVLTRMTDELVRRIVVETAERLIREEIEKIKANPE